MKKNYCVWGSTSASTKLKADNAQQDMELDRRVGMSTHTPCGYTREFRFDLIDTKSH